jgi:hypothetical protein
VILGHREEALAIYSADRLGAARADGRRHNRPLCGMGRGASNAPDRAQVSGTLLAAVVILPPALLWAWSHRRRPGMTARSTLAQGETADLLAVRTFARSALRIWPAPEIADADPELLGITASRRISGSADDSTLTRYVPRDIDSKAAERLRSRGAVLLVGEPASGVTRTAYELALTDPTRRKVLAPRPTDGLRIAVTELEVLRRLAPPTRVLLWLDNIADHSTDGLNRSLLDQCREESLGLRVIATIRSPDYQSWRARQPELATLFGDPVQIRRLPTPKEKNAAELLFPNIDFSQGIAAAFTGTRGPARPSDRRKLHLSLRATRGRLCAKSRPDRYRHRLVRVWHPPAPDQGQGHRPRSSAGADA